LRFQQLRTTSKSEVAEGYGEIKHTNAALVIYTDGVPSDFYNNRGSRGDNKHAVLGLVAVLKDVAYAAKSEYNVSLMLTINIKTDEADVIEAYNDVDTEFGKNDVGVFREAQTFSHIDIVDDAIELFLK
jgi:hypothetical protein